MRLTATLYILFFCIYIISCKEEQPTEDYTGFKQTRISLATLNSSRQWTDTMATVTMQVPAQFDTFYRWHRTSDCLTCGRLQYRFASNKYVQFAESGTYWTTHPDSIYQLTFIHDPVKYGPPEKKLSALSIKDTLDLTNYLLRQSTLCDSSNVIRREFLKVNGRPFILVAFTSPCSAIHSKKSLYAAGITSLNKMQLFILGETNASDTTGFIDDVFKSIRSIDIREK